MKPEQYVVTENQAELIRGICQEKWAGPKRWFVAVAVDPVFAIAPPHTPPYTPSSLNKKESTGVMGGAGGKGGTKSRFVKPTVVQVIQYGRQINVDEKECEGFFDYHTSKGWIVGRAPMKDWRAALRTWKRNSLRFDKGLTGPADSGWGEGLERRRPA
jgi:hypothetical protein